MGLVRYFLGSSGGVFDDGKRAVEGGQKCWVREGSGWGVTDQVGGASARVELVGDEMVHKGSWGGRWR